MKYKVTSSAKYERGYIYHHCVDKAEVISHFPYTKIFLDDNNFQSLEWKISGVKIKIEKVNDV